MITLLAYLEKKSRLKNRQHFDIDCDKITPFGCDIKHHIGWSLHNLPFHFWPLKLNKARPNSGSTFSSRRFLWSINESKSFTANFFSNFGSRTMNVGVLNSNMPETLLWYTNYWKLFLQSLRNWLTCHLETPCTTPGRPVSSVCCEISNRFWTPPRCSAERRVSPTFQSSLS